MRGDGEQAFIIQRGTVLYKIGKHPGREVWFIPLNIDDMTVFLVLYCFVHPVGSASMTGGGHDRDSAMMCDRVRYSLVIGRYEYPVERFYPLCAPVCPHDKG